jgi:hypothetical protein
MTDVEGGAEMNGYSKHVASRTLEEHDLSALG